jgi:rSAM/selenodomain-associated transferase 1
MVYRNYIQFNRESLLMSCKSVLIIQFAKAAVEGKVKTRLARDIGSEKALQVHKQLCLSVNRQIRDFVEYGSLEWDVKSWLALSTEQKKARSATNDFRTLGLIWDDVLIQHGGDLGVRMQNAFAQGTKVADLVLIVGSDFPLLDNTYLTDAIIRLKENDLVIGPCDDGGYGLIGIRKGVIPVFDNVHWGTEKAKAQTVSACRKAGLTVYELEVRHDVDTLEDLQRWYDSAWRPKPRLI